MAKAKAPEVSPRTRRLVIVESPAKARTIQSFLQADEYVVDFCLGHVRDLCTARDVPSAMKKADPDCRLADEAVSI